MLLKVGALNSKVLTTFSIVSMLQRWFVLTKYYMLFLAFLACLKVNFEIWEHKRQWKEVVALDWGS
jgi:hypothetical protein